MKIFEPRAVISLIVSTTRSTASPLAGRTKITSSGPTSAASAAKRDRPLASTCWPFKYLRSSPFSGTRSTMMGVKTRPSSGAGFKNSYSARSVSVRVRLFVLWFHQIPPTRRARMQTAWRKERRFHEEVFMERRWAWALPKARCAWR